MRAFVVLLLVLTVAPPAAAPRQPIKGCATPLAAAEPWQPMKGCATRLILAAEPWQPMKGCATRLILAAGPWQPIKGCATPTGSAQTLAQADDVFYLMPLWLNYFSVDDETFAREVADLRRRFGADSERVRIGFSMYIFLSMDDWNVDVSQPAAVRKALAKNVADIDRAIERARTHDVAISLSFQTAIRGRHDPVQKAAELEDRRNMQWYADNSLASGWWTHSQYARKQRQVAEAYIRELGKVVANRMARFPDTLVAASGDGEVELAYEKSPVVAAIGRGGPLFTLDTMLLADYSPFAVAEFRDWLRRGGMYAPGQPLAGDAYEQAARYAGDASPATDTNRDGHTLNGDFGTAFTTWDLRHFDWSLRSDPRKDPGAIPASVYDRPAWNAMPAGVRGGFDAPREYLKGQPWWEAWHLFRQQMVHRYNRDFARWMTTSRDPETGTTVPVSRWYSDQIAADYLFGHTPEDPDVRFITSASSWWTADVAPYGRLGITSFSTNTGGTIHKTLPKVAPHVASRGEPWGILEWHPSYPMTQDLEVYRADARLVALYGASLVIPIYWDRIKHPIQDTPFETAIQEMIATLRKGRPKPEIETDVQRLNFAVAKSGSTPAHALPLRVLGRGAIGWRVTSNDPRVIVERTSGTGTADIMVRPAEGAAFTGDLRTTLTVSSDAATVLRERIEVLVRPIAGETKPPFGSLDAPPEGAKVPAGEIDLGGWALDDVGVRSVEVWREPVEGERPEGNGLITLGAAAFHLGARPDVAKAFADLPASESAGWGVRVDISGAAGAAPREIKLHVLVTDVEGNVTDLGPRTVTVQPKPAK